MKKINPTKAEKEINKVIGKLIKNYGCILVSLQWDDETFIEECAKRGHTLYHDPGMGYNLELNV